MIELRTGVPGSGKTLSMVEQLAKLNDRWKKNPEETRPVYVHGIPDLALPHHSLPLKLVQLTKTGAPQLVPDWESVPDGSLILIDEAQGCFSPRSAANAAPEHVAYLNTHRHHGLDLWLTTQHPRLIDHAVRALVGKHMHYRRLFGGSRAMVYEWDACSDSLSGMKNAVTSYWSYPKKVFEWYKSAEIHTKQKFKLPLWVWIPVIGLAMAAYFVPKAYFVLSDGVQGKAIASEKKDSQPSKSASAKSPAASASTVAPLAQSAPVEVRPEYVGCVASATKCSCITTAGISIFEPPMCKESANGFGYLVKITMGASNVQQSQTNLPPSPQLSERKPESPKVASFSKEGYGVLGSRVDGVRQPQ